MHNKPQRKNFFEDGYSKFSKIFLPYFLKTNMTPNQVTIVSGIFGVVGSLLLVMGEYPYILISGIFIQIYTILDLIDGDIARARNMQSSYGMWLDIFFDKLIDFLIILFMAVGLFIREGDPILLIGGILLIGIVFSIQFIMVINDCLFKSSRAKNEEILTKERYTNGNPYAKMAIIAIIFYRNHISLQHSSFLFFISLFAIIDELKVCLYFLLIHGAISLMVSALVNFYKLKDI